MPQSKHGLSEAGEVAKTKEDSSFTSPLPEAVVSTDLTDGPAMVTWLQTQPSDQGLPMNERLAKNCLPPT